MVVVPVADAFIKVEVIHLLFSVWYVRITKRLLLIINAAILK